MCLITKKLKVSDVRQKRLDIKKKVQNQFNLFLTKKLSEQETPFIIEQKLRKHSEESQESQNTCPSTELSDSERNSKFEEENQFFEKYQILEKIGQGGHSSVYKCLEKESGEIFAVKITRLRDEEMIINSKKQFEFNKLLQNNSIIKLKELIVDEEKMTTYNVQEYCDLRDLKQELANISSGKFPELQAVKLVKSLLQTLEYLHSMNICHRDIKPENILYNQSTGQIKLIDLECSKNKKETEKKFQMWTKTGSLNYQAPQYFLNTTFTQNVDIWAVGVVAYEILTGRLPFRSYYHKKTVQLIISSEIDFASLDISQDTKILLKGILEKDPNRRSPINQSLILCEKALQKIKQKSNFSLQKFKNQFKCPYFKLDPQKSLKNA